MGIKVLRESEPGQPLPAREKLDPAAEAARIAERDRLDRVRRVCQSPYGRGRKRLRRGRLRRMRARNSKRKFIFGSHFLHESGHAEGGHHTNYYHATKGWRRRGTLAQRWAMGNTLMNWMLLRLDLIDATKAGDEERVKEVRLAFKRTLELP
jgi:hypothetical protein